MAPVASAADSTTYLAGVTKGGDVAAGGGRVFVAADNQIVVADAQGALTGAVTGLSGALGLAMAPDGTRLYAALSGSNEVAEIDTAALTITRRIDLAAYPCPSNLSLSGDRLWVGYGCRFTAGGGVLSLDLSATAPEPVTVGVGTYSAPLVAAAGNTLVVGETDINPSDLMVYDVSVTPATLRGEIDGHTYNQGFLNDLAITPDGSMVISVFGSPYQYDGWDTTSLTKIRTYGAEPTFDGYPNAVALSPDGSHVAGGRSPALGAGVALYDTVTAAKTYTNDSSVGEPVAGSLTFSGNDLFSVLKQPSTGRLYLWRLHGATLPASTLTLTAPSSATVLEPFTMTGQLTPANGSAPGTQPLVVTRQLLPNGPSTTLAGVTTAADGKFTVTDTPPAAGNFRYKALWDGSSDSRWSTAVTTISVAKRHPSLTLSGPATGTVGEQLQFSGALDAAGQAPPPGTSLKVHRTVSTDAGTVTTALPAVTPASDGSFSFADTPAESGQYTYTVWWAGNAMFSSVYASHDVTVQGEAG
ncbi:hypothetical protein [Streptosporangium canum]|uniref:hypothetical protein n=1 Tax=Streptosporangium canum TaxID=324952 RepID=UPI0037977629